MKAIEEFKADKLNLAGLTLYGKRAHLIKS
ncbi:hypothetical protein SAMN06295933_0112 [Desulfovibrio gilichinskyi]|uniref:Uncharacterized protein n=1 Tax=Desulfovibrio gilichinskyi TaxID=1519643 RepID=A0A1X7C1F7_9BACT|nr:hypothetical protein SAMN06295933_0112 [Desulfovibrio gilichinskyi]